MRIRPLRAGVAAGALALTAIAFAPSAQADVLTSGTISISGQPQTGSDCTFDTAPSPVNGTFADGQTRTRSLAFTSTATSTSNSTDTATVSGSAHATVRSSVSGGVLHAFSVDTQQSSSIHAVDGSASSCHGGNGLANQMQAMAGAMFTQAKPMWMRFDASSRGTGGQSTFVELVPSGGGSSFSGVISISASIRNHSDSQWLYLPAGSYTMQAGLATTLDDHSFGGLGSASSTGHVGLTFVPAGSAAAPAAGSAKPAVTFPSALTCSTGKATVKLTSKIKGASKVTLSVNGATKKSIAHPGARTVVLSGVPRDRDVTLKAVVKRDGRSTSVSRAYRSC